MSTKHKTVRQYGLFQKNPTTGKWEREGTLAFPKSVAVQVFQNKLLDYVLAGGPERCLKPIKA